MDIYELRYNYYSNNPDGHYFDYETLKFFGESLSKMRVLKNTTVIKDYSGEKHTCYILSSFQRIRNRRHYSYFDVNTFDEIFPG